MWLVGDTSTLHYDKAHCELVAVSNWLSNCEHLVCKDILLLTLYQVIILVFLLNDTPKYIVTKYSSVN